MAVSSSTRRNTVINVLTVFLIGGMIFLRARMSAVSFDVQSSNFAFFWLAGRMVLDGESPYDEAQYLAGVEKYGIKWHPNKIFFYPLPLAIFCVPLGIVSLADAYLAWQVLSLASVAAVTAMLLNHWPETAVRRLLLPLFISFFFFGPLYLTLHTGSIGAFTLLTVCAVIILLEQKAYISAGVLLSLTILKPSQGLPILFLAGIWFLARGEWKVIGGVAIGCIALLLIGMIQDPLWVFKFRSVSEALMNRTLGIQSNVWAFSFVICNGSSPCASLLGGAGAASLLGLCGFLLWQERARATPWGAFNLILPISFVSTVYLWSYDQVSYIIPIVWIMGTLVTRTRSYVHAMIFLLVLDVFSLFALQRLAVTELDLWSLGTSIIVLGTFLWLYYSGRKRLLEPAKAPANQQ